MLTREEATACLLEERLLLVAFIGMISRNYHLAEDIFQELCIKALVREEAFESREHLLKWARISGKGRAINVLRTSNAKCDDLDPKTLESLADSWPDSQGRHEYDPRETLAQCLNELTDHNRQLVRMRYFEGHSGHSIAETLGRKLSAVHQALARIHKTLGECIRRRTPPTEKMS